MSTKKETCANRIASRLASREEEVARLFALCDGDSGADEQENAQTELDEMALSVDSRTITTILLSCGGPSDELQVTHDGADIESVIYVFKDWFDGARESVDEDSALYRYASQIIECQVMS